MNNWSETKTLSFGPSSATNQLHDFMQITFLFCSSLSTFFFFPDQKVQPLPGVMSVYSTWQYTGFTTSIPTKINNSCKARDSTGYE